jgi:hypothetical protein
MNVRTLLIKSNLLMYLVISSGLVQLSFAQESNFPFAEGVDYRLVTKAEGSEVAQLSELESLSNVEMFYWYGCESCYQVEAQLTSYLQQHSQYSYRRTPLVARAEWRQQAYLQAIREQIKEQALHIYRQCLTDCSVFQQLESGKQWLFQEIDPSDKQVLNLDLLWQTEKNYRKRAELFSISQVPTIIINETYQVSADQAKTSKRMMEIVDFLLTK